MNKGLTEKDFKVQCFHSANALVSDSSTVTIRTNFIPDYWVVVLRTTATGERLLEVYPYAGENNSQRYRLSTSATLVLPIPSTELTLKTTVMSGNWSAYAVKNLDGFLITS